MKNFSSRADVRYDCIYILREIEEREVFANKLIATRCLQGDLSKRDRNLLTELVNGVIRHRLSLDTIISFFSKFPLPKTDPRVLSILRLGLYQIIYLDKIPPFAAIDTSVELTRKILRKTAAVKFTNAILRSAERSIQNKSLDKQEVANPRRALYRRENTWCIFKYPIFPDPAKHPSSYIAAVYSHPEWLIKRWIDRYGKEKTIEICKINNHTPKIFLRINHKKISTEKFLALLDEKHIHAQVFNDAIAVDDVAVFEIPGFTEGLFFVQDISAMKVVPFLKIEKSNMVLDMCAAPGGKATHIAELAGNSGKVYALDISLKRLHSLKENCLRMNISNIYLVCGNASEGRIPFRSTFDRILIDAPCSNTGVLSRRVEARWRLKEEDIHKLASLQYSILETGSAALRPNGFLVYSTCSIEPEENQDIIKKFLHNKPQFSLDCEEYYLPGTSTGDGGYMARIYVR